MTEILRPGPKQYGLNISELQEDDDNEKEENIGAVQVSYKKYEQMVKIIQRLQKRISKSQKSGKSLCMHDLEDNFVQREQMYALNDKYKKIQTQLDFEQQECALAQLIEQKQMEIFQLRQENAKLVNEIQNKHNQLHQQMWVLDQLS